MAASRNKAPAIGSAQWILDERQQSTELVTQELEDFGFSLRNELEWLNEHMADIFANNGQNNLDVFKTPGKLRGKTPRTTRKKNAQPRQPLGDIFSANAQSRPSPAQQSLKNNLQKNTVRAKFQIAEDSENVAPTHSPAIKSPVPRPLFTKNLAKGKENSDSAYHTGASEDEAPATHSGLGNPKPVQWSLTQSTQDTVMDTQEDTQIFTQDASQSTQATQATQSFRRSFHLSKDERRDTDESFVSAKEAFGSKNASKENLRGKYEDDTGEMDVDRPAVSQSDAQDTTRARDGSASYENTTAIHLELSQSPQQSKVISETHNLSTETQETLSISKQGAHASKANTFTSSDAELQSSIDAAGHQDDTVVHHEVEDQMDIDEDDVRSPSNGSSPVKPLVRKSSLTFASLPAREPLLAKKSMGNRVSRTSHVDQIKGRGSQLGRFTGGKSLGGSQHTQVVDAHDDAMDVDDERPGLRREESETTRLHNSTSTKSLKERLNMLNQRNEPPKRISQSVMASQSSQQQSAAPIPPPQPSQPTQHAQPSYPQLPSGELEQNDEDEDDDWISPIRTAAPAPIPARPMLSKSYSAETRPVVFKDAILPKPISVSNPDFPAVVGSTTPAGSPTGKKNMDGPLSASKAKLYSAFRAAKEKIIGSSAASAQAKLDVLAEGPMRPTLHATVSSDDIFSPKRNDKNATTLFSHLRSPSKESVKTTKSAKVAAVPGSPVKGDGRRTRSSSEREKQREKETREKESKEKHRADERLKEMREKEQSKAAAHYQKAKAAAKTPVSAPAQPSARHAPVNNLKTPVAQAAQSRPGTARINTGPQQDAESADDMPPPPPPKSLLPTGTGHKLREPKRLAKVPSKDTLPKGKPQSIRVNLHGFGQAPKAAPKTAPQVALKAAPPAAMKPAPAAPKTAPAPIGRPTQASRMAPPTAKPAPRMARPQPSKAAEKPKPAPAPAPAQSRADLGAARPMSRLQTVQDANRINVPPINPAKPPPKRPFQPENDEPLHRPAKRPSQQAKSKPVTPAHAQFAQGKIPFAEPAQPAPPTIQYPNGEDIKLPDIMTDSEDEDSENEFEQPSWVNTPNLREMLERQQLADPEQIFGPIAKLNMEEVFPNKERHKRFRDRTSSAYWANDQITEEERRKEREARERLVKEGAWTYNPSPRPGAS